MDNALIDDRRIHVDFSQSVAKLWSQYRRKDQTGKGNYVHLVMCSSINFEWNLFVLKTECYSKMMSSDCMTVCI